MTHTPQDEHEEKTNHAEQQARAQLESIVEMVAALTATPKADAEEAAEEAEQEAQEAEQMRDDARDRATDWTQPEILALSESAWNARQKANRLRKEADELPDDDEAQDDARRTIEEDALSVQVRSDWYTPGNAEDAAPAEFEILLCTGGPAVRIIGDLDNYRQPERPRLQYQDWFTAWTELVDISSDEREALRTYCEQFWYGE